MSGTERPAPLKVAVLISGSGTNLQAIIDAQRAGDLNIDIVAVLSDNPGAYGLTRAAEAGLHTITVNYQSFASRADYDQELRRALDAVAPDLIVLAGYMRILPDETVDSWSGRMLNIHPSLLPDYPGLNTYRRALEANESYHGTTVHVVIPELDAGPPIMQYRVKIQPAESEDSLRERVQQGEYLIYPAVIRLIAAGELRIINGQPEMNGAALQEPVIVDEPA